jgi:hypothetical protein
MEGMTSFPSYPQWKSLVLSDPQDDLQLAYDLSDAYETRDESEKSRTVWKDLAEGNWSRKSRQLELAAIERYRDVGSTDGPIPLNLEAPLEPHEELTTSSDLELSEMASGNENVTR